MFSGTYKRLLQFQALALGLATLGMTSAAMAQDKSQAQIWKEITALEKTAMAQVGSKDYRAAANTYFDVLTMAQQLPQNDERMKRHFTSIDMNLGVIDNRLETRSDFPLKEKVLRAKLPLVEKLYGKNSLSYQVGVKKLMFTMAQQGKTNDVATLDKDLIKDTSGPVPNRTMPTIGRHSARNK